MRPEITTLRDEATPALRKVYDALAPGRRRHFLAYVAGRVAKRQRAHFRAREASGDSKRARKGWRSRHFWAAAARATTVTAVSDSRATVTVASREVAFKARGGTVTPKRGKYLAIPLRAEAYAKGSPREWDGQRALFPVRSRRGNLFLASMSHVHATNWRQDLGAGPLGGTGLVLQYLLVRRATVPRDGDVIRAGMLEAEAGAAAESYAEERLLRR
jgi:hypothetical protein